MVRATLRLARQLALFLTRAYPSSKPVPAYKQRASKQPVGNAGPKPRPNVIPPKEKIDHKANTVQHIPVSKADLPFGILDTQFMDEPKLIRTKPKPKPAPKRSSQTWISTTVNKHFEDVLGKQHETLAKIEAEREELENQLRKMQKVSEDRERQIREDNYWRAKTYYEYSYLHETGNPSSRYAYIDPETKKDAVKKRGRGG